MKKSCIFVKLMYNGVRRKSTMKLRRVLGSFAWVALAAALILVNAAAANA